MIDLLNVAVRAHGGLDRWRRVRSIRVAASITGAIWFVKGQGDALKDVVLTADTVKERLTVEFPGQDKCAVFEPQRIVIQHMDGTPVAERDNPEQSFVGQQRETSWDDIHVIYFVGEALWTYLSVPFLYARDGFVAEEIASIEVDREVWRRLKVTFPDHIKSHTRTQISCFGPDGLLRRHDYTVDILGGATGLNYASGFREVGGIIIPTKRRATHMRATTSRSGIPCWSASTWARSRSASAHIRGMKYMSVDILFQPLRLGAIKIRNRIIMAPMTRMRAGVGHAPTPLNAEYYAQRASAGMIVTEGTAVSPQAQGFPNAPGIYTAGQIAGWRAIVDAVHARGGTIVMQIAHNGRNSHSSLLPDNLLPVAPSAVPPTIPAFTSEFQPVSAEVPRALDADELPGIVAEFRQAAHNAIEAGFDGVEIQAANGHLIEQFLENGANQRTDAYGGTKENRARLLFETIAAVTAEVGTGRLGVRLSPFGRYAGIYDSNPLELFTYVVRELSSRGIAYLHLIEARGSEIGLTDQLNNGALNNAALFRPAFAGPLITAAAYTPESAAEALRLGHADAVAFGRSFVANPDLPERIRNGAILTPFDRSTAYGGGAHGYTDYPALGVNPEPLS